MLLIGFFQQRNGNSTNKSRTEATKCFELTGHYKALDGKKSRDNKIIINRCIEPRLNGNRS